MDREALLLIVEDNDDHFALIEKALRDWGVKAEIIRFADGQAILDFLSAAQITKALREKPPLKTGGCPSYNSCRDF